MEHNYFGKYVKEIFFKQFKMKNTENVYAQIRKEKDKMKKVREMKFPVGGTE